MVWTNPEPHDVVSIQYAEGTIVNAYAHRVHQATLTHALEIQTWVARI